MKVTKTIVLILVIALFLLLFPFAVLLLPGVYDLDPTLTFGCLFTFCAFITAVWYWKVILTSTKTVKVKLLFLTVALFLLLFPLAAFAFPIMPRSPGRSIEDYSLIVSFNEQVKEGLTATTRSEEFKQYFIENFSAIDSEFPEVELNISFWDLNYTYIEIKWIYTLNQTEKQEVGNRLADAFLLQWYTSHAEYYYVIGDEWGYDSRSLTLICWILLVVLTIATLPAKAESKKSSTKNIVWRQDREKLNYRRYQD